MSRAPVVRTTHEGAGPSDAVPVARDAGDARGLFRRCSEGEPDAWEEFLACYRTYLRSCARRILTVAGAAREEEIEECVQDALVLLLKGSGTRLLRYDGTCKPTTWLWLCMITVGHDRLRKTARHIHPLPQDALLDASSPGEGPDEKAERSERAGDLAAALGRLSSRQEIALRLFYLEGLPARGVAAALRTTVSAAERLLAKARRRLRSRLGGAGMA
ncbi:MAG: sigma-70 family RNA polymerase sigma factor [Planctomycetes bacterium]|nr:sigma-70 family RNA polymerase sigma factor [Planctomycetota bacterium]